MPKYKTGINRNTIRNLLKNSEPIVEVIHNSIDAEAKNINIEVDVNKDNSGDLFGSFDITVFDNGIGFPIEEQEFKNAFTTYQDSPKKNKSGMYGKRGQGRYKYLKLVDSKLQNLKIYTRKDNTFYQVDYLIDDGTIGFEINISEDTEIEKLFKNDTSTIVQFKDIDKRAFEFIENSDGDPENDLNLLISNIKELLAIHVADALISKKTSISINKELLSIDSYIYKKEEEVKQIKNIDFKVFYIVWNDSIKLKKSKHILYFDKNNSHIFTSPSGSYKDKFGEISYGHTILVHDDYFKTLDEMIYTQPVTRTSDKILNELQFHLIAKFRKIQLSIWNEKTHKTSKTYQDLVSEIDNGEIIDDVYHAITMPFIYNNKLSVNNTKVKTVIARLMKVLVQSSPNSYLENLNYIADLKETDNEIFDYVRSNLDVINIVMQKEKYLKYLDVLEHFDNVVNGKGKGSTKERTQLQKIVEKNLWIIDESYEDITPDSFSGDKALKTIFEEFGMSIYNDPDIINKISQVTNKKDLSKVPDLFIPITDKNKKVLTIIELKKPNKKIDIKILQEVQKKYVNIIRKLNNHFNEEYKILAYAISSEKTESVPSSWGTLEKDKYIINIKLWKELIDDAKERYLNKLELIDLEIKKSKWNKFEDLITDFNE